MALVECLLELPNAFAHFVYLGMQLFSVGEDEARAFAGDEDTFGTYFGTSAFLTRRTRKVAITLQFKPSTFATGQWRLLSARFFSDIALCNENVVDRRRRVVDGRLVLRGGVLAGSLEGAGIWCPGMRVSVGELERGRERVLGLRGHGAGSRELRAIRTVAEGGKYKPEVGGDQEPKRKVQSSNDILIPAMAMASNGEAAENRTSLAII